MAEDALRVPSGSGWRAAFLAFRSTPEGRTVAVFLAAARAWTLLILMSPRFSFSLRWPRARLPIETAGLVVAGLAAALAYLRYTLDGARASLLVAVAFLALASNRLVFGVVLDPSSVGGQDAVYAWTAGRLAAGIVLLAAARPGSQVRATRARPLLDLARIGAASSRRPSPLSASACVSWRSWTATGPSSSGSSPTSSCIRSPRSADGPHAGAAVGRARRGGEARGRGPARSRGCPAPRPGGGGGPAPSFRGR